MRASFSVLSEILRLQIWVVPALSAVAAAVGAMIVVGIEERMGSLRLPIEVDAVSARSLLSAVSSAMISFTGLVFSVTMLVLQLASSQLSPRVMRTFLRDRFNQSVLGLFVATFVFALLTLATVTSDFVPQLGVIVTVILVLAAVFAFVAYIDHMAHAIRPTSVIHSIAAETREAIDRNYDELTTVDDAPRPVWAEEGDPDDDAPTIRWAQESGYIQAIDEKRLLEYAGSGLTLELTLGLGEYLVRGAPMLRSHGAVDASDTVAGESLGDAVRVGPERTMSQDPEFGFRQLVDVALRALSPSLNDPTTANQVIDQLHDLLRHLLTRKIDSPRLVRADGRVVIVIPAPDWDAFVHASVDEIHDASASLPQVRSRLRSVLEALAQDAEPSRLPPIRRALTAFDVGSEEPRS